MKKREYRSPDTDLIGVSIMLMVVATGQISNKILEYLKQLYLQSSIKAEEIK